MNKRYMIRLRPTHALYRLETVEKDEEHSRLGYWSKPARSFGD